VIGFVAVVVALGAVAFSIYLYCIRRRTRS